MAKVNPTHAPSNKVDILQLAGHLVNGDRQEQYGDARENWHATAQIMSALTGWSVTPEEAVLCAIAMKLARLRKDPSHLDSQVDLAGYALVLNKVTHE